MSDRQHFDQFGYQAGPRYIESGTGSGTGWIILGTLLVLGLITLVLAGNMGRTPVEHPGGAGAPPVAAAPESGAGVASESVIVPPNEGVPAAPGQ